MTALLSRSTPDATTTDGGEQRSAARDAFLRAAGWDPAQAQPLPGDASFRRYFRLADGSRRQLLMDAPPPREDIRPFLAVAERLRGLGYSAPQLGAADPAAGFLLVEDFGDCSFADALRAGDGRRHYELAVDLLIDLHRRPDSGRGLPRYDAALMQRELALFSDWYLPAVGISPAETEAGIASGPGAEFAALWADHLPLLDRVPSALTHRDYFPDNLMLLDRPGLAGMGLIDFQDAVDGPVVYDLMSLIHDARRDLAPDLVQALYRRYADARPDLDPADLAAAAAAVSLQRNLKVIGIFTRLSRRDGKHGYLAHIPRLWRLVAQEARHPALRTVGAWLDRVIPDAARRPPALPSS